MPTTLMRMEGWIKKSGQLKKNRWTSRATGMLRLLAWWRWLAMEQHVGRTWSDDIRGRFASRSSWWGRTSSVRTPHPDDKKQAFCAIEPFSSSSTSVQLPRHVLLLKVVIFFLGVSRSHIGFFRGEIEGFSMFFLVPMNSRWDHSGYRKKAIHYSALILHLGDENYWGQLTFFSRLSKDWCTEFIIFSQI